MAPRTQPRAKAPPKPSTNAAKCACGGDHSHKAFARTDAPLQRIIASSNAAATPLDYHQAIAAWLAELIPAAKELGMEGPNFMHKVETGLEKRMREEADMQSAANARTPRDVDGGIFHGGLRGRVQEAQHQIKRARKNLGELKIWEEREAARKTLKGPKKNG